MKSTATDKLLVKTARAFVKSNGFYTHAVQKHYVAARQAGLGQWDAMRLVNNALYAFNHGGLVRG